MPVLPQFRGGSSVAFGPAPTPQVRPSNVGELISEAGRAVGGIEDALRQKDDEDGRVWAAKTQTELRAKYNQRLIEAQNSGEDLNGLVTKIEGELNTDLASVRKAAPNRYGAHHLDLASPDFLADVKGAAFGAEARYRVTKRLADTQSIIELNRSQLFTNPSLFAKAYAETKAVIDGLSVPVEAKAQLAQQLQGLGASALQGMIENGNPYEAAKQLKSGAWNKYVDPDRLAALTNAAQGEIKRREAEARAAQAARAEVAVAGLEVKINQFANGQIETLDQTEIDSLKGQLTPSAWSSLQRSFDDARARREQDEGERVNVAALIQAGERIDPGNSKQKKAYDEFFRSSVVPQIQKAVADLPEGQRESAFTGRLLAFIKSQGVVPETVQANVRTALRSGSPQQKAQAAATIDQIKVVSPRALLDIDDDVLRQANAIASYVDYGADPEQAARMAEEAMRQGETERKALGEEYDRIIKENPTTAWLEDMQGGWLSTVKVPLPVAVEIDAGVRREFLRNGGNLEAARRTAVDLTKKRYGETTVNGVRELTRNPIEQHYELPWLSKEQIAKAAKVEAIADMKSGGAVDGELTEDRVRIRPYPVKGVVAADGRPAYAIEVQDSTGAWTVQMDLNEKSPTFGLPMPWAPSFAREKAEREARIKSAIDAAKAERLPLSERITLPGDRLKAVR